MYKRQSPLFAAFFVISGAGLDLGVFKDGMIVLIGVVYIPVSYTHLDVYKRQARLLPRRWLERTGNGAPR